MSDRPRCLDLLCGAGGAAITKLRHPVIRCSRCGDQLPFGRIGRCDDCVGRGGNPIGCLVLSILAVLAIAVLVGSSIAAPREAAFPTTEATRDLSGLRAGASGWPLPGAPLPEAGDRLRLPASPRPPATRYRGLATWYCLSGSSACTQGFDQSDMVAAIDTDLGFEKGDRVRVRYGDRSVVVTVIDVCLCPGDRLIDLTSGAFARLASLDVGVIPVTLEVALFAVPLPATDTAP